MNKTSVGVIGVGHLGKIHANLYQQVELAELVGIYDSDYEKAEKIANELNVTAYRDCDELLENIEAVNIVTPTSNHFEMAQRALEKDCHLFIEKPIMATEEEAHEIINLAKEKDKIVQVGHIERFNPAVLAMSDVPLKPLFIESHRLASFNPRGTDVAVKFESGCVANVTASRISAKKMRKMRIFQNNRYISVDFIEGFSEIYYIDDKTSASFQDGTLAFSLGQIDAGDIRKDIKYNKLQRSNVNPLKYELNGFVDSVQTGVAPLVSGEEGLAALNLANKVLEKIAEHTRMVEKEKAI